MNEFAQDIGRVHVQRIPLVTDPDEEQRTLLGKAAMDGAEVSNLARTLAHNARLLERFNVYGGYFQRYPTLPTRVRELAIIATAVASDCTYEAVQHSRIARRSQLLSETDLDVLMRRSHEFADPLDLAVAAAADEICRENRVSDGTWAELEATFTVPQLIEMLMLVGFYRGLAGYINTVGLPVDNFWNDEPVEERHKD